MTTPNLQGIARTLLVPLACRAIAAEMNAHGMSFDGFTTWGEVENIRSFVEWLHAN